MIFFTFQHFSMYRSLNWALLRLTRRPPILHFGRHIRGNVSSSPKPDYAPSSSTLRFGFGVRKSAAKDEEIVSETEPGDRLASYFGHPRLPPMLDEEDAMAKTLRKPNFDEVEDDVVEKRNVRTRPVEEDDDLIIDQPQKSAPSQQIGQFEPLDRPIPASTRKPRAFLQTYTLTPLVNESELLRNLVDIGVNLSQFDNMHNVADWLIKLDWEKDVRPRLKFLTLNGVPMESLGEYVTGNPWILQQPLDDLEVRIRYLESKKFSKEAIAKIVTKARYWLNFHVKNIDKRLGWLQKTFELSGDEVRFVVTHSPKLITIGTGFMQHLQYAFKEEMGFDHAEIRQLLLKAPRLWRTDKDLLNNTFDYLHNQMGLSHKAIMFWPIILRAPRRSLKQRHEYLKNLGRDQYDPTKPNFVSLQALGKFSDKEFAEQCAKTSIAEYNEYLKKF